VGSFEEQRHRFGHYVIRGEQEIVQLAPTVSLEDFAHTHVVHVTAHEQRKEEARIEKDQSCGSP
jgi:hypothetical protein